MFSELSLGSHRCLYRCNTPLMHSTAGMPEKKAILSRGRGGVPSLFTPAIPKEGVVDVASA